MQKRIKYLHGSIWLIQVFCNEFVIYSKQTLNQFSFDDAYRESFQNLLTFSEIPQRHIKHRKRQLALTSAGESVASKSVFADTRVATSSVVAGCIAWTLVWKGRPTLVDIMAWCQHAFWRYLTLIICSILCKPWFAYTPRSRLNFACGADRIATSCKFRVTFCKTVKNCMKIIIFTVVILMLRNQNAKIWTPVHHGWKKMESKYYRRTALNGGGEQKVFHTNLKQALVSVYTPKDNHYNF